MSSCLVLSHASVCGCFLERRLGKVLTLGSFGRKFVKLINIDDRRMKSSFQQSFGDVASRLKFICGAWNDISVFVSVWQTWRLQAALPHTHKSTHFLLLLLPLPSPGASCCSTVDAVVSEIQTCRWSSLSPQRSR